MGEIELFDVVEFEKYFRFAHGVVAESELLQDRLADELRVVVLGLKIEQASVGGEEIFEEDAMRMAESTDFDGLVQAAVANLFENGRLVELLDIECEILGKVAGVIVGEMTGARWGSIRYEAANECRLSRSHVAD